MLRQLWKKLAFATLFLCAAAPAAQAVDTEVVTIAQGQLVGERRGAADVYFGIPYAAAPVGDLRWRAPAAAPAWPGVRRAVQYGARCPQGGGLGVTGSEDCLFLNITAPAQRSGAPLPVAVWIHGGSFKSGNGEYGGETFARDGVIFVSMNYRLGPLGGFAHPALQSEIRPGEPHTNYGMLDQIAALRWVQANIAAFGGDPSRVTIFGESAGGTSVAYLVASPLTRGLFRGAIVHSGAAGLVSSEAAYVARGAVPPLADRGVALAQAVGVRNPTPARLRAVSAANLVRAANRENLFLGGPVVDGVSLPDGVREIFAAGRQQPVALIAGANSYEATLSAVLPLSPRADAFLRARIAEIAPLYGRPRDPEDAALRRMFYGDVYFLTQMRALARGMSRAGGTGYLYHFAYDLEGCRTRPNYFGVGHAAELLYTFDVFSVTPRLPGPLTQLACSAPGGPITTTAADRRMSATKHGYWVNFMRTGIPNGQGFATWSPLGATPERTLHFTNTGAATQNDLFRARLDFIEANYAEIT